MPITFSAKSKKIGASRMAGFMLWTNTIAVLLLLVGFVTPGWLAMENEGYQDYALWYMTRCTTYSYDREQTCQTMSYRTIQAVFSNRCYQYGSDCSDVQIGSRTYSTEEANALMYFSTVPLPLTYSDVVRCQALYSVGLILATVTLTAWYRFRKRVYDNKTLGISNKKWMFMLFLKLLSALFVYIPVFEFAGITTNIVSSSSGSPLGIVFAGFGGGMMVLGLLAILMHLLCCRNNADVYICSPENDEIPLQDED